MNEDEFFTDLNARIQTNVIRETLEDSLLAVEHFIPEDLWEIAEEIVRDHFWEQAEIAKFN